MEFVKWSNGFSISRIESTDIISEDNNDNLSIVIHLPNSGVFKKKLVKSVSTIQEADEWCNNNALITGKINGVMVKENTWGNSHKVSKQDVLKLLAQKGFRLKYYENESSEGDVFYAKDYTDKNTLNSLFKILEPEQEEVELNDFTIELHSDFNQAQWIFGVDIYSGEYFHHYESLDEFYEFAKTLPN